MKKTYTLKNKNRNLIDFTDNTNISQKGDPIYPITIEKVYWENADLFPVDLFPITGDSILSWIYNRRIPKGRKNASLLLEKCGLKTTALGYIDFSKGLSLTDTYWITPQEGNEVWEDCSLYRQAFDTQIANLAFTGQGSIIQPMQNSPEFTTNGRLAKKWFHRNGQILLMKSASRFPRKADGRCEPFAELYATQLAKYLGLKHIPYEVESFTYPNGESELVSVCPLYTSEAKSYIPMSKLLEKANIDYRFIATEREERKISAAFTDEKYFADMIFFDCLIGNTDRHLNNFGIIVDADTNKIIEPMPLFDHGNALWPSIDLEHLQNSPKAIFETELTAFGVSAPELYQRFARPEHRQYLESIKEFKFDKNTPHQLPERTLHILEESLRLRAEMMLKLLP